MFGVTRTRSATATDTVAEVKADDAVLIKKRKPAPDGRYLHDLVRWWLFIAQRLGPPMRVYRNP